MTHIRIDWSQLALHRDLGAFGVGGFGVALLHCLNTQRWWLAVVGVVFLYLMFDTWRYHRRIDMQVLMPLAGHPEDKFAAFGTQNDPGTGKMRGHVFVANILAVIVILLMLVLA
jgi:hypothetical protein